MLQNLGKGRWRVVPGGYEKTTFKWDSILPSKNISLVSNKPTMPKKPKLPDTRPGKLPKGIDWTKWGGQG